MQTVVGARLIQHASNPRASLAVAMPGRDIGYAELLGQVRNCAAWLARERCLPAEAIGITIADELPHLVATLALLALGVPQIGLPTQESTSKRLSLAQKLAVKRVIVADPRHALPGCETLLLTPEIREAKSGGRLPDALLADPDGPAMYLASSGTTGQPKICALSQRMLEWRIEQVAEAERPGPGHRALALGPIEDFLSRSRLLRCMYLGLTSVFQDGGALSAPSLQELCASLRVTCLELSVLHVSSLVRDLADPRPLPPYTAVWAGGAALSAKTRRAFKARFGVPLCVHYGTREFGRIASTSSGADDDIETVGTPAPWIELEIVDDDGKALPRGEIGEIRVRGEGMARGYHEDPAATARHFRDGWFYPGDLGSLAAGGALCLHGRADDMMNLNGIKVFPAEIECVLEEHPAVRAAAAFAKTSAAHGDIPVAAVELHDSARVGVEELMSRARERLGMRAPRKIIVLEALPRNQAGKIVKRDIAGLLAARGARVDGRDRAAPPGGARMIDRERG